MKTSNLPANWTIGAQIREQQRQRGEQILESQVRALAREARLPEPETTRLIARARSEFPIIHGLPVHPHHLPLEEWFTTATNPQITNHKP